MPKTHTDDIAAALPSAINGPFTVVDPADAASWVKIDPAAAQIAAAGGAGPTRVVTTSFGRSYGSGLSQYIGNYIIARYVNAGATGGFYAHPLRIPDEMDVTRPSKVRLLVNPLNDATTNGQVIRFILYAAYGGTVVGTSITSDWNVPDDWTTDDCNVALIDNGSGHTFDGNTFTNGDTLGLRIIRAGGAAEDTFDKTLRIAEYLQFEYTAKAF